MISETEALRERLQLERFQRAEQDLERDLVARGTDPDEAKHQVKLNRDRIEIAENGEVHTRTRQGGFFKGATAIPLLAQSLRMDLAREATADPVAMAEIIRQKRASGLYGRL